MNVSVEGIRKPVQCYECSTHQPDSEYCADPFNRSHPNVKTAICNGPCSKLVQRSHNGHEPTFSHSVIHSFIHNVICLLYFYLSLF